MSNVHLQHGRREAHEAEAAEQSQAAAIVAEAEAQAQAAAIVAEASKLSEPPVSAEPSGQELIIEPSTESESESHG
jgi:regulator of protease activity HflC (stomatin/prohibitin superfamily)